MCHRDRRPLDPTRSPQRHLWVPLRAQGPRCQGDPSRFLLARYNLRRKSSHEVLRSLPEVLSPFGQPLAVTKLIAHTWLLQRWGLDIVGPLPTAQGNLKFTFVVIEYFTKWIEARAVFTKMSKTAPKFFWQNIICRFGVPSELTIDNGKQFDSQNFRDFCFSIGTKIAFTSVYHPQSNGVVECTNGKIFTAIKKNASRRQER
jgi:transposase InsO family protein